MDPVKAADTIEDKRAEIRLLLLEFLHPTVIFHRILRQLAARQKLEAGAKVELERVIPTSFQLAPNQGSEEVAGKDRKPS